MFPLDDVGHRRPLYLSASGPGRTDLDGAGAGWRDPFVWRTHRERLARKSVPFARSPASRTEVPPRRVLDPETLQAVPREDQTMGAAMFRGIVVMKGYFRNPKAIVKAFSDGWFHSGDLGVMHPDG